MKLNKIFSSDSLSGKFGTYLAATATVGLLALGAAVLLGRAKADSDDLKELRVVYQKAQHFELNQLEKAFHLAGSYGGDLDLLATLWADDATLTVGTTVYTGKDAILAFFAAGGAFHNNWVGLTPAFKFTADIHGDTAEISFQCDYVDPSVTPAVVRLNRIMAGTVKKVRGNWLFWRMDNLPATL
jgi:hypothetical protein